MERYSIINEKNNREIVLLRGSGCVYRKCIFCDYYTDRCSDEDENFRLNKAVLEKVTGIFGDLEVINSGSVFELDKKTLDFIKQVCKEKKILPFILRHIIFIGTKSVSSEKILRILI